ncbi:hypothetical protein ACFS5L_20660 [Streptomyces phyllanthi]|uniref:Uncharacterized protein n=1 Tax=Streptomyces phyllanthi TaxID=1803180 RepID=A0A5N8WAD4_9ACTN|nr:hypothetical protein [Streptomyces phyllanthi]MPY44269.1 hypothetical protein [Streptomyces phyllanthi]
MNQRRITRAATGTVITVLALGVLQGAGAAGADSGNEPADTCVGKQAEGPKGSAPDDRPLYRALAYIENAAKEHRGIFTGLAVDDETGTAHVYRVPGEEAEGFDADICGAAEKGVTVRLYDTEVAQRELEALVDRISDDMERWEGDFSIWSIGLDADSVVVGVSDPAKAGPILRDAYGEETMRHVRIEQEQQATLLHEARGQQESPARNH